MITLLTKQTIDWQTKTSGTWQLLDNPSLSTANSEYVVVYYLDSIRSLVQNQ